MKKLLHIIASPRGEKSRTLQISNEFINSFKQAYPDAEIETVDLFREELPQLSVAKVGGKYILMSGKELTGNEKEAWKEIEEQIERFKSADAYLISTPMWNFGIPYVLKQYIDIIFQPRYLFAYTENGPEGLIKGKSLYIVTTRGGDYSPESPAHSYDQLEPYLKTAFGFIGFEDITFLNAQPMDAGGPELSQQKLAEAKEKARNILS
jgi:FMN-dependent NADH-azoreductase